MNGEQRGDPEEANGDERARDGTAAAKGGVTALKRRGRGRRNGGRRRGERMTKLGRTRHAGGGIATHAAWYEDEPRTGGERAAHGRQVIHARNKFNHA